MKKIFLIATLAIFTLTASAQRWAGATPGDNTGRTLTFTGSWTKSLAATDSISPNASHSYYKFLPITGAKTLIIKSNQAQTFDEVTLEFTCDTLTAGRVVTFSTGTGKKTQLWSTTSGNSVTVKASKQVLITFIFEGTYWAEEKRSIQY